MGSYRRDGVRGFYWPILDYERDPMPAWRRLGKVNEACRLR